jgi:hypothetical protein
MIVLPPQIIPLDLGFALRRITLRITREGFQTPGVKTGNLLAPGTLTPRAFFIARDGFSDSQLFLAAAVDTDHLLLITDEQRPRLAAARFPSVVADVVYSIDLNDGAGGSAGVPATLAATVRVDGVSVAREMLVVERQTDGAWRIAGSGRVSGNAIDLRVTGGEVYAVALDDFGTRFQAGLGVVQGDVVRPAQFAGWLYQITEPGTLPSVEPEWWAAEGDNASRPLGTARAIAVRYYQPLAHGPVPVEMS